METKYIIKGGVNMETKQQYISKIEKECVEAGIKFTNTLKNQFEGEWFDYIIEGIKNGKNISQEIFDSLDEMQKYYLNKHFIIQGINIIEESKTKKVKEIEIDVMKFDNGICLETVKGQEVVINNITFGIHEKQNKWFVTELQTGIYIGKGTTQEEAIHEAELNIDLFKKEQFKDSYKELVRKMKLLKTS
ncbi:hypothetical protein PMX22_19760 [Clostridium butyricum]|uniref:hypothetical protein n=1 Tax=Clostridium butyricum TaxID=1492 RepID=UPI00232EFF72|nr:hypothetical protein [Clostridium butyricum]MDB2162025.1 hypothetical protein [Clostridium butyricum]